MPKGLGLGIRRATEELEDCNRRLASALNPKERNRLSAAKRDLERQLKRMGLGKGRDPRSANRGGDNHGAE